MANSGWQGVSKKSPCPICKSDDWCCVSADGAIVQCMRSEAGSFRTKTDKNGTSFYLHRLTASSPAATKLLPRSPATPKRGDPDLLHEVYGALLGLLHLSDQHRSNLRKRGLSDEAIDAGGYKSFPFEGRSHIACELHHRFEDKVLQVPGFGIKEKDGNRYLTLLGAAGLLIPCRGCIGRIVALKVRRDDDVGPKYVYISSTKLDGPGPGAPVHVPIGIRGPVDVLRLTEGELKADCATHLSGLPTISVPGVTNWRPSLEVIRDLQAGAARLAFDAELESNSRVACSLWACSQALAPNGFSASSD